MLPLLLPALISGAASVAAAAMQPKETKTTTTSEVDYEKMVKSATAAGFNPLTVLRNGGSAGFSTSSTVSPNMSSMPAALAQFGGSLGDAMGEMAAYNDPFNVKKRKLDNALIDYQLKNIGKNPPGTLYQGANSYGVQSKKGPSNKNMMYGPQLPPPPGEDNTNLQVWWKNPGHNTGYTPTYNPKMIDLDTAAAAGSSELLTNIGTGIKNWWNGTSTNEKNAGPKDVNPARNGRAYFRPLTNRAGGSY